MLQLHVNFITVSQSVWLIDISPKTCNYLLPAGVRNRMSSLRLEADKANERADELQKRVAELSQQLYETEKDRDSYHK